MFKNKLSADEKISAVKKYLNGLDSEQNIVRSLGVCYQSIQQWIQNYLNGLGSEKDICIKYGIRARSKLQKWIMKYNNHEELRTSRTGETIMIKGCKTTYDERIEIIQHCIENEHKHNYAATAQKYRVSYQQVYTWLRKYGSKGVEGLLDKRGNRKPESQMSELEKLRAENQILKAENKRQ